MSSQPPDPLSQSIPLVAGKSPPIAVATDENPSQAQLLIQGGGARVQRRGGIALRPDTGIKTPAATPAPPATGFAIVICCGMDAGKQKRRK